MIYEIFEPDPDDEYYEEMCSAAYAFMFNERKDYAQESTVWSNPDVCPD